MSKISLLRYTTHENGHRQHHANNQIKCPKKYVSKLTFL